ncbi:Stk1 family PASTA domain-containing Ser/Thr kinase [Nocardioides solisilvae]|uniref:Stk1 family PASTA domain-containing Ser/Thr kinase n=1 Tax=Nocardioides solisilvae TaxID=1542435 RepID=UPI000D74EA72|nr:Stk1 family PASTA domain-containing Ser/Thr kinase [Nocardioides solisilvae]
MSKPGPTVVGGRYELGELLGRGGMAEVRKGTDTRLGRTVAVKRLRTDLASDATFQARFRREAQSSASLNHPSIVSVYDTGEEWSDDGSPEGGVAQPYIVMEHVAGRTLRDILREGRKILPERALEITSDVLGALDYSHRAGIIHRDIKPGNVMLTPGGDVKVMDFGIARAVSDASNTMTQTAAVVGTAQYLSPEQARGETVDSRSDVYSTGCLLYELLTGRPPFVGESPVAVAYQHVREPAQPPSVHDPDLTPEIDAIVLKALAKRVEDRYQSAAAMRTDIERYLAGHDVRVAPVPTPAASGPATTATRTVPPVPPAAAPAPAPAAGTDDGGRRVLPLVLIGLVALGLLVLAAWGIPKLFDDGAEEVRVPALIGLTEAEARAEIRDAELVVGEVEYEADPDAEADEVIRQSPNDVYVEKGSTISLVVSTGAPMVEVPFLVGQDRREARDVLRNRSLKVKFEERESDEPADQVVEMTPGAGEQVPEGTVVTLFFSDGPEQIPSLVGMRRKAAEQAVKDLGFVPEVVERTDTTEPRGTVIGQTPEAGRDAPAGSTVVIYVSVYEPPPEQPTPTEQPTDQPTPGPPTDLPTPGPPTDLPTGPPETPGPPG